MFKAYTKTERFLIVLGILGLFLLTLFIIFSLSKSWTSSYFARADWNKICSKIKNEQVDEILVFDKPSNIDVTCLVKSDYKRLLPNYVGPPTAENIIYVMFSDGTKATLENWGGKTFAVRYKDSYYEIDNLQLFEQVKSLNNVP